MSLSSDVIYDAHTRHFLESMRKVRASKREFYEALKNAIGELEVEIQACKETMFDGD